jgi:uncharacterized SAM-binding protein YcdF (DUF218 family)
VILVEDRSRNTLENGLFTRQLLDSLGMGQQKHLLVTSAWHLRRAAHCFEKAAVNFDIYGTDFLGERPDGNFFQQIEPSWDALMQWDLLLKEWVGYMVN